MPELPEVEHWRRRLLEWIGDRVVQEVRLWDPAVARPRLSTRPSSATPTAARLLRGLAGQRVTAIERVGKRLGVRLSDGGLLVHLGMTGRWSVGARPAHARLGLSVRGQVVWFADPRRLGCAVPTSATAFAVTLRRGLGPDALDALPDASSLSAHLKGRRALKVALLDQAVLAGLGNIHVTEVLWRAALHPARPAGALSQREVERLRDAIERQLAEAVRELGGDEALVYVTQGGANPFAVYGREGARCPRCEESIVKSKLSGRGTWWCPRCQPKVQ